MMASMAGIRSGVFVALALVGLGLAAPAQAQLGTASSEVSSDLNGAPLDTITPTALSRAFRAAAERVLPSVVYITVEREADTPAARIPEQFRDFFDLPDPGEIPPERGGGSGFIMSGDGLIVTNAHVVRGATRIRVRLVDGREFVGRPLASDPSTDVALLQVDVPRGTRLPAATLGDSDEIRVGDWVLALGNPLGLDFTVTAGIVSAKGRQLTGRTTSLESFIQTDAAINPGNSGGPLIDLFGRVVGINTAISGPRFVGYGFAVPIDLAGRVVEDLLEYGYVRRPMLGVRIDDVTAVDAEVYGLDEIRGAEVKGVEEGSPAAEAGVRLGDVVLAVNGQPIGDATDLTTTLARLHPGEQAELRIVRDGREREVSVRLGEFPHQEPQPLAREQETTSERKLGFAVAPLGPEEAVRFEGRAEGVVVSEVESGSPAEAAGLDPNQLLLSLNGVPVESPADVERLSRDLEAGDVVSLRVRDPQAGETILNYRLR